MAETDFVIAIGMMVAITSFVIFYSVGTFDSDVGATRASELDYAKTYIADQLNDHLTSDAKKFDVILNEIGNASHTESLKISMEPSDATDAAFVYDDQMEEVSSTFSSYDENITIKFSQSFDSGEIKHVSIFYKGKSTSKISYDSSPDEKNVTADIISEQDIPVISYEKCSNLTDMTIDEAKEMLGTDHYFQLILTGCDFGPQPPDTDVVIERIPVIIEDDTGKLTSEVAVLKVWL